MKANNSAPERRDVWKMFDRVAHRYDLLNRMLSFGQDVRWRKKMARLLPVRPDQSLLDLATGTGDLLLALYGSGEKIVTGVGLDMAGKMLAIAQHKLRDRGLESELSLVRADANRLPLASGSFDLVTIAFGIRNVVDVPLALREMKRVLSPEGQCMILEFSLPRNRFIRWSYLVYFRHILPVIGALISGDSYAYRYLNETVESFPYGRAFCDLMSEAGFAQVRAIPLTFGVATIYIGQQQANHAKRVAGKES